MEKEERCGRQTSGWFRLYEQLRMKRMDPEEWRTKARECVEEISHLIPQSPIPRLFMAQILMTEDKMEEAGWILNRVQLKSRQEDPAVFCYYLYLTTLYNREEAYGQKVQQKGAGTVRAEPGGVEDSLAPFVPGTGARPQSRQEVGFSGNAGFQKGVPAPFCIWKRCS